MRADDFVFPAGFESATIGERGLTFRDYIAIEAMKGLLSNCNVKSDLIYAEMAYEIADAMIERSNK